MRRNKILALLLALIMVACLLPAQALAATRRGTTKSDMAEPNLNGVKDSRNDGYIAAAGTAMLDNGGSSGYIGRALYNTAGAVYESRFDLNESNELENIGDDLARRAQTLRADMDAKLTFANKYDRDITIQEIISVKNNIASIKQAILDYGRQQHPAHKVLCRRCNDRQLYTGYLHPEAELQEPDRRHKSLYSEWQPE